MNVFFTAAPSNEEQKDSKYKDWVFINYTYKRFEGLTQRGPPLPPFTKRWGRLWYFYILLLFVTKLLSFLRQSQHKNKTFHCRFKVLCFLVDIETRLYLIFRLLFRQSYWKRHLMPHIKNAVDIYRKRYVLISFDFIVTIVW